MPTSVVSHFICSEMIPLFPSSPLLRLKSVMPLQSFGYTADWFFNIFGHFVFSLQTLAGGMTWVNCSTVNGSTERPRCTVGMYCTVRESRWGVWGGGLPWLRALLQPVIRSIPGVQGLDLPKMTSPKEANVCVIITTIRSFPVTKRINTPAG